MPLLPFRAVVDAPMPSSPLPSVSHRSHSLLHPQKDHSPSSPPGSSSTSTMPIAEFASDAFKASMDRCIYFNPPPTTRGKCAEHKLGAQEGDEEQGEKVCLRRFFFGDSPQLRRPPAHPLPPCQFDQFRSNVPISPNLSTIRDPSRPMLSRKRTFGGISHSSRTISVDFDSETSGTTEEAERMTNFMHQCNGKTERAQQKQQSQPMVVESPSVVARHHQQTNHYQQQQQQSHFNGASQFDTQSLQSRSRTRSIGGNHHTLPPNVSHHRQHSSGGFRHGSCTNLSALDGSNPGAGPLVLYNGGPIDGECSPTTTAPNRHSMALIDTLLPLLNPTKQMPSAPFWYHQPMIHPHPPPPPFYYSAATLPHPPPMDLATFRRALKESERMEKERQLLAGEQGQCAVCWEFCCGGSAIVLWLVITLIAVGFLGFLLLAIYFL